VSPTPKVVFDTQIYLRALINFSSGSAKLVLDLPQDYELLTSHEINHEVMDVLTRSSIRKKFRQISDMDVKRVEDILADATLVEVLAEDLERICRDPKDDMFLACAKAAQADYLISEDNDLLVIGQHHNTRIINIAAFLTILENRRDQNS